MCLLLETLCIKDEKVLHPEYHLRRMKDSAAKLFPGYQPPDPEKLWATLNVELTQAVYRWRIIYGPDGFHSEVFPYSYKPIRLLKLIPTDIDYSHKYADRTELDKLHKKRGEADDVLLVKNGKISDTTFANIVFLKGNKLFTPDPPLLMGTALRRLLDEGRVIAKEIKPEHIPTFDAFWLVNALRIAFPFDPVPISGIIR
ncbi:MAG: aminotransferase class IV [Bacteroidales bacterium]